MNTLPVELIHQILDDVPMFDIFFSMCLVNKRLRSICLNYPRFEANFSSMVTTMKKNEFDYICTLLRRSISQIVLLILFDKTDPLTPSKNELFFCRFNYIDQTFGNFRSLTLAYITYNTWCLFQCRLSSFLIKLSIHIVHSGELCASQMVTSDVLSELLFHSSSLKDLSVKMSNYSKKKVSILPQNPVALSSVQYFRLEDITIDPLSLFAIVPAIHSLEIASTHRESIFNRIYSPPLHLQRLRIEFWNIDWMQMTNLLLSFPPISSFDSYWR